MANNNSDKSKVVGGFPKPAEPTTYPAALVGGNSGSSSKSSDATKRAAQSALGLLNQSGKNKSGGK